MMLSKCAHWYTEKLFIYLCRTICSRLDFSPDTLGSPIWFAKIIIIINKIVIGQADKFERIKRQENPPKIEIRI